MEREGQRMVRYSACQQGKSRFFIRSWSLRMALDWKLSLNRVRKVILNSFIYICSVAET